MRSPRVTRIPQTAPLGPDSLTRRFGPARLTRRLSTDELPFVPRLDDGDLADDEEV